MDYILWLLLQDEWEKQKWNQTACLGAKVDWTKFKPNPKKTTERGVAR